MHFSDCKYSFEVNCASLPETAMRKVFIILVFITCIYLEAVESVSRSIAFSPYFLFGCFKK